MVFAAIGAALAYARRSPGPVAATALSGLAALWLALQIGIAIGDGRGREAARVETLEARIEASRLRQEAEDEASAAGDIELCINLGRLRGDPDDERLRAECEAGLRNARPPAGAE